MKLSLNSPSALLELPTAPSDPVVPSLSGKQIAPQLQMLRQKATTIPMITTMEAILAEPSNFVLTALRQPYLGAPLVMSPNHHHMEGLQRPWH